MGSPGTPASREAMAAGGVGGGHHQEKQLPGNNKRARAEGEDLRHSPPPPAAVAEDGRGGGAAGEDAADMPKAKRTRRKLSCLSCQKLKCRCEYDAATHACVRCRNLRISCSLTGDTQLAVIPGRPVTGVEPVNIEERLNQQGEALAALQSDVRQLLTQLDSSRHAASLPVSHVTASPVHPSPVLPSLPKAGIPAQKLEELSAPADVGVPSAPTVVVRDLSLRLSGGFRRTVQNVGPNLVELGLLDEATAETLYQSAIQYPTLRANAFEQNGATALRASPFLHATCCLLGIYLRNHDLKGTQLHRQIYEHVRLALGQVILASPLPLNEINAVILLNTYSPMPFKVGTEYIDSWLLSGSCAQQSMLSISFSSIVKNIKDGTSTQSDHRALRLWGRVCLQHLQWGATTGRPPVIPAPYMDQCSLLMNVYDATIQDGMLVAEILLFRTLHVMLAERPNKHQSEDPCDDEQEFRAWKAEWQHLFALPRSSELKMAYYVARLIRAVQSTEDDQTRILETYSSAMSVSQNAPGMDTTTATTELRSSRRRTTTSDRDRQYSTPHTMSSPSITSPDNANAMSTPGEDPTSNPGGDGSISNGGVGGGVGGGDTLQSARFHEHVLSLSMDIIDTLLEIAQPRQYQIPDYLNMCAAYAVLVIGHYGHKHYDETMTPDRPLELLRAVYNLHCSGPVLATAVHLGMTSLEAQQKQKKRQQEELQRQQRQLPVPNGLRSSSSSSSSSANARRMSGMIPPSMSGPGQTSSAGGGGGGGSVAYAPMEQDILEGAPLESVSQQTLPSMRMYPSGSLGGQQQHQQQGGLLSQADGLVMPDEEVPNLEGFFRGGFLDLVN